MKHQCLGLVGEAIALNTLISFSTFFFPVQAFGSSNNFTHSSLVTLHQLPLICYDKLLSIVSIDGEVLLESILLSTAPLYLQVGELN